jgi:hypothetical protein
MAKSLVDKLLQAPQKLKGKNVIMIGGADQECLTDIYVSMKSFGITPTYNHNFIYNASTSDDMTSTDKTPEIT